jgi:transketolase
VVEEFEERFPDRYLNAGVAEQNMTGVAAGIALSGSVVFTYSIANFPTLRCLEQIRNDVCFHNADVKIVAVGGGFVYGSLGHTHHAIEDLAVMRSMPNMTVLAPADPVEARWATRAALERPGPCYIRLGRAGEPVIHDESTAIFEIGRAYVARKGTDITLISCGGMLQATLGAADLLAQNRIEARVLSMHTLKPFDADSVLEAARETGGIVTVEEHRRTGGLASAVADALVGEALTSVPFASVAVPDDFDPIVGDQEYLRQVFGLTADSIARVSKQTLENRT